MKLTFSDKQKQLLKKIVPQINVDSDLSDDDFFLMCDEVADYYTLKCLGEDYFPNREGVICEELLEIFGNI